MSRGWPGPEQESGPAGGRPPSLTRSGGAVWAPGPDRTWVPPGPGCRGRRWRAPELRSARLAWTRSRTAGGIGGEDVEDACCAQFFVGFLFFVFFFLKKKKKVWFPRGRCVCAAAATGREARRSALRRRPGGILLGERAAPSRGVEAGGQGTASCFPSLVWLSRGGSYASGGKGAHCYPWGLGKSALHLSAVRHLALWLCPSPGVPRVWLKGC